VHATVTADTHASNPPQTPVTAATVVVPAYNEERGLAAVLDQLRPLRAAGVDVLVVDDGSCDRTALVGRAAGVRVVQRERNGGKGAAIRTGLQTVSTDRVVVIDADGTYPVHAIPAMIRLLDDHDLVLGSRMLGRGNIPFLNRLGNAGLRMAIRVVSGFRSADPLTGLYALRREHVDALDLRSTGFGIEAEIAIKCAQLGLRAVDYPIAYGARIGNSKLHPMRDGLTIGGTIAALALGGALNRMARSRRRPPADGV
jgi:dolichol-phosphate mannosyltransferase